MSEQVRASSQEKSNMKRNIKIVLIGTAVVVILGGIAAVYMFWKMSQPLYTVGSVSVAESLRGPLEPPLQIDSSIWQVESDISLHFDVYGKGRPVVIVHGGPGIPYANAWKGFKLLEDRFAFYYYHQRGAGKSTRPIDRFKSKNYPANVAQLDQTLGIGAQIADIERIRRILKERKLLLVGHSFGGFIASLYTAEFPDQVEKLILVAPAAVLTPPEEGSDLFEGVRHKIPQAAQTEYNSLLKEYFNFGDIFSKSDAELVDLHTQVGRYILMGMGYDASAIDLMTPTPGGWSSFAVYFSIGGSPDYRAAVGHVTAPTLILHGENDTIALKGSREYEKFIPNAKFVSIGCSDTNSVSGHFIYDDCPAKFAAAVRDFLDL